MLFSKCSELPLSIFIKIILEDNIGLLVQTGKHTHQEVSQAWEAIYSEYFELVGSTDSKYMVQTARTMLIAENKIDIINACIPILSIKHNETCYKALAKIGYPIARIDDPVARGRELARIVSRAKALVHIIAAAGRELKRMEEGNGTRPSEQNFIESIARLSKFQGYRIDPEKTSVAEYIAIQRHYTLTVENRKH